MQALGSQKGFQLGHCCTVSTQYPSTMPASMQPLSDTAALFKVGILLALVACRSALELAGSVNQNGHTAQRSKIIKKTQKFAKGLAKGAIIAIALAAIAVFLLIIAVVFCVCRKHKGRRIEGQRDNQETSPYYG